MKYKFFLPVAVVLFAVKPGAHAQAGDNRLWYRKPALSFNEALPVGNGRMGAMVYGRTSDEYLSLNESTLWSGDPDIPWNNPQAKTYLPLVRAAALKGEYKKADSLCRFMQGPYTESYMPMADLHIRYREKADVADYRRTLDLDSAIAKTSYRRRDISFTRSVFASYPDSVIVIREEAGRHNAISFTLNLSSKLHYRLRTENGNELVLTGKCPGHVEPVYLWKIQGDDAVQYDSSGSRGMMFMVRIRVMQAGGQMAATDSSLTVTCARNTTIIISAVTSFNGFDRSPVSAGKDYAAICAENLKQAVSRPYPELLRRHVKDHQSLFSRLSCRFGKAAGSDSVPTDERLRRMPGHFDPALLSTLFQYGRYILIASSRPGGQPSNLKGVWSEQLRPEYSSNWCIDHDAQMSYYPVETTNLSELHQPFLQLIKELSVSGAETARINYGLEGWCAHHNTDIWRKSSPVGGWGGGNPQWANWNMSEAWLCEHYFEHYQFTRDTAFLKDQAYPVMKGAAEFLLGWLIPDSTGHYLITAPSFSPENTFITPAGDTAQTSVNSSSDIELSKDLFRNLVTTAAILHIHDDFTERVAAALARLKPYPIGEKGNLLEWAEDWRSIDPAHRHLSHMYAVFPGAEINPFRTPALAAAAKKALTLREKTNGSWGFAWKAACWARLGEGDSALRTLNFQLRYVDPQSKTAFQNLGLYPNLFNSEVPGVILNGNTCITAAVTEMLLQSQTGIIDFLPALPAALPEGEVKGLVARGGFVVNLSWSRQHLQQASLRTKKNAVCTIRLKAGQQVTLNGKSIRLRDMGEQVFRFEATAGSTYIVR